MIIIDFFLGVIALFVLLVLGLGLSLWFNIRRHLNPFLRGQEMPRPPEPERSGEVIEGEYRVIEEE